jgi:periplasmic divalent cation tolerance protein
MTLGGAPAMLALLDGTRAIPMDKDTLLVMTTCPDEAHAASLSVHLVESGLAGCINRLPGISSVYRWEGELKQGTEVLLLIKTVASRWDELEAAIKSNHPYELPEIIAVPITNGHKPYLDWIRSVST